MGAIIIALAEAVGAGLKLISDERATKFNREFANTRLEIEAEERKGDDASDAKIERLYGELKILADAARNELAVHLARGK